MPASFRRVVQSGELAEGEAAGRIVNGWPVLIARVGGALHAVIDRCPHAASDLSSGKVRRGSVMCPLHGARFELATGRCIGGVYSALEVYAIRESDGWVEVEVPDEEPGPDHAPVATAEKM